MEDFFSELFFSTDQEKAIGCPWVVSFGMKSGHGRMPFFGCFIVPKMKESLPTSKTWCHIFSHHFFLRKWWIQCSGRFPKFWKTPDYQSPSVNKRSISRGPFTLEFQTQIAEIMSWHCLFVLGCFESRSGSKDRPIGRFSPSPPLVWRSVLWPGEIDEFSYSAFIYRPLLQSHLTG